MATEQLPVKLTDDETLVRADELAKQIRTLDDEEKAAKDAASLAKDRIKTMESNISRLARIVRERKEDRPVEVREARNDPARTIETIRCDTDEVVRYRAMYERELVRPLFPVEDDKTAQA
jgi:CRISPR/Cas system-associated endonuclease Cas1